MLELVLAIVNVDFWAEIYLYSIFCFFAFFIYQYFRCGAVYINAIKYPVIWLYMLTGAIFSLRYPAFSDYPFFTCLVLYCLLPAVIFTASFGVVYINRGKRSETIKRLLYAIVIGCTIHAMLNSIANYGHARSEIVDFFRESMAATNLGAVNTYIFALFPALMLEKDKKIRIIGFICFGISLVNALILGTRTQIVILLLVSFMSIALFVWKDSRRIVAKRTKVKHIVGIVLFALLLAVLLKYDVFGIKTKILGSNFLNRFYDPATTASDSYRLNLIKRGIVDMWKYPFGGNKTVSYFHNYWLDVGRVGGVIPFIIAVLTSCILFVHAITVFRNKENDVVLRYAVLGLYAGVFLNFLVEPIMDGYIHILYRFILTNGAVEAIYYYPERNEDVLLGKSFSVVQ